jgi:hypothetical protein
MRKKKMSRRPPGYWQNRNNVTVALTKLSRKLGHFPNQQELNRAGLSGLECAIRDHHEGIRKMAIDLGYKPNSESRRSRGHWKKWSNVEKALRELIIDNVFPTLTEIQCKKLWGLHGAIRRFHGIHAVRARMGFDSLIKPVDHWTEWSNVENALRVLALRLKRFPKMRDIRASEFAGMEGALWHNHDGIIAACQKMGYVPEQRPKGFWLVWHNVEKEIIRIVSKISHFPTHEELLREGGWSLISSIYNSFHSLKAVRARMGYVPVNAEILKLNADELVHVLFALLKKSPGLKSDILWSAIKKKWYAPDLEQALKKAKRGDLKAFHQLLAS